MIKLTVVTEMSFKHEAELENYLSSDSLAKVTGFADEIRTAWQKKASYSVSTNRPEYGLVTKSYITCEEYPDMERYENENTSVHFSPRS